MDDAEITEEEYDISAKRNIERWVSAHIIPVRPRYRFCHPVNSRYLSQEYPVSFNIREHQSLLPSKSITFKSTSRHCDNDWACVTLEDGIRIIGKKEVYQFGLSFFILFLFILDDRH